MENGPFVDDILIEHSHRHHTFRTNHQGPDNSCDACACCPRNTSATSTSWSSGGQPLRTLNSLLLNTHTYTYIDIYIYIYVYIYILLICLQKLVIFQSSVNVYQRVSIHQQRYNGLCDPIHWMAVPSSFPWLVWGA